jgi:hypothetical protein
VIAVICLVAGFQLLLLKTEDSILCERKVFWTKFIVQMFRLLDSSAVLSRFLPVLQKLVNQSYARRFERLGYHNFVGRFS